jgi:hypothetical protein
MAPPGETLYSGGPRSCADGGIELVPRVCRSGAGFYIGSWCRCGPCSRESGYVASRAEAEALLEAHPAEYAHSTELAADAGLDLAKLRQHFEVLADALAAPSNAQLEQEGEGWPEQAVAWPSRNADTRTSAGNRYVRPPSCVHAGLAHEQLPWHRIRLPAIRLANGHCGGPSRRLPVVAMREPTARRRTCSCFVPSSRLVAIDHHACFPRKRARQ